MKVTQMAYLPELKKIDILELLSILEGRVNKQLPLKKIENMMGESNYAAYELTLEEVLSLLDHNELRAEQRFRLKKKMKGEL